MNILVLSSIGVIISAALKVLSEMAISSWGIAISATVFLFALIHLLILLGRNHIGAKAENLDKF